MESSSSTSQEKSAVRAESKEDVSLTAEYEQIKSTNISMKDLEKSDKYSEGLVAQLNAQGKVSKTTLIELMRDMVSQSSGYSTLLKEMESQISKVCHLTINIVYSKNEQEKKKKLNKKTRQNRKTRGKKWFEELFVVCCLLFCC